MVELTYACGLCIDASCCRVCLTSSEILFTNIVRSCVEKKDRCPRILHDTLRCMLSEAFRDML